MQTLNELFEAGLQDIYYAEKAISKALPKMAKKATSEDLAAAFETHIEETEGQITRLEEVFGLLEMKPKGKKCPAIDGILEEGDEVMTEAKDDMVRDAGMIAAAQAVEHYEMARYGSLVCWAKKLGMDDAAELLQETLDQETATDEKLAELAESETQVDEEEDDSDDEEKTKKRKSA